MSGRWSLIKESKQPSVVALLFAIWGLIIPLGYSKGLISGDGDLARHLVLGKHILKEGPSFSDVFSHTKPGETFLAYEWLSEVVLTLTHSMGGLAAVAVLAALLIAGSVAISSGYLRTRVETGLVLLAGNLIAVFTYPHWIARPHLFSFLLASVLLVVATRAPGGKRNLSLVVLFAAWANLHPGFLYGLAILGAYLVGDALDHGTWNHLKANAWAGMAAGMGTLLNPFGPGLHWDIVRHIRDTEALSLVEEFQPLSIPSPYGLIFFACLAFLILLLAARPKRPPFAALVPFLAALFAAFLAVRNVPLFALFAFPLLLGTMGEVAAGWRWKPLERPRAVMVDDDAKGRTTPLVVLTMVALMVLVATSGRIGPFQVVQDEFSPEVFPVAAVAEAEAAGLSDRTPFNEYLWGGYILYAWPEQQIFIDGMANFFGGALMEEYITLQLGLAGWERALQERGVDMLILRPDVPLAASAKASPGWEVWFEDTISVVLLKTDSAGGG